MKKRDYMIDKEEIKEIDKDNIDDLHLVSKDFFDKTTRSFKSMRVSKNAHKYLSAKATIENKYIVDILDELVFEDMKKDKNKLTVDLYNKLS